LHNNGGTLNIGWDTTKVSLPFGVPTIAKATVSIQEAMKNNPKDRDYYNAAVYYLQEGQDLNQAKEWIAKAVAGNDKAYWYLRQQSLILAGLNEIDGAIEAAKASLELAKTAGNSDYITLNETSIAEWSK
jgi:tetratricopeptide (TPR) repeat protein